LIITNSEFVNLNYGQVSHCLESLDKNINSFAFSRGLVLSLNNFQGPVEVINSTFNKNMVFFPSAAFSNAPKFNETVISMPYQEFLSGSFNQFQPGAFLEMKKET